MPLDTAPKLLDVLDATSLVRAIHDGHVRVQYHPTEPLAIYNYTERCQFERAWSVVTETCRGLIINGLTGEVVARPFAKFYNYGEHPDGALDLTAPAEVTNKLDGSLGIVYREPSTGQLAVATRGSFTSEQARHATRLLRSRYPEFEPPPGMTCLFEVIYPANRIVLDYNDLDDLVLLSAVDMATGESVGPDWVSGWSGPHAETFTAATLADALALPPRQNAEGVVVRMIDTGVRVKIKQADYVTLHRIITSTSARTVWEFLAVNACKHLVDPARPKHWASKIGIDPVRATEILKIGDDWLDRLLTGVPDEFYTWLRGVLDGLNAQVDDRRARVFARFGEIGSKTGWDRKDQALALANDPDRGLIFALLDDYDITSQLWKGAYPDADRPFTTCNEDVA
jgi:RNA ligase